MAGRALGVIIVLAWLLCSSIHGYSICSVDPQRAAWLIVRRLHRISKSAIVREHSNKYDAIRTLSIDTKEGRSGQAGFVSPVAEHRKHYAATHVHNISYREIWDEYFYIVAQQR